MRISLMTIGMLLALGSSAYAATKHSLQGGTLEISDLSHHAALRWKTKLHSPTPDQAFKMAIRFKNPGQPDRFKK